MSVIADGLKTLITQKKFVFSDTVMRELLGVLLPTDKMLKARVFSHQWLLNCQ